MDIGSCKTKLGFGNKFSDAVCGENTLKCMLENIWNNIPDQ